MIVGSNLELGKVFDAPVFRSRTEFQRRDIPPLSSGQS